MDNEANADTAKRPRHDTCGNSSNIKCVINSAPIDSSFSEPNIEIIENKLLAAKSTIKSLKDELRYVKKKHLNSNNSLKNILFSLRQSVPFRIYKFIESQVKNCFKSPEGRRWCMEDKDMAMKLYLASPRAYRALSKYFCFPTKQTLLKTISHISMETGFSNTCLFALKSIAKTMKNPYKTCIISFDEIKLQKGLAYNSKLDKIIGYEYNIDQNSQPKLATHALVFMVRGLCKKWKQVFGSFFSSNTLSASLLQNLLTNAITKILDCGLNPICVVCDQGTNNQELSHKLKISESKPYFYVNDHKVFFVHDPPHLVKCMRNNFKNYNTQFDSQKIASWQHIVSLYDFDVKQTHRLVPKLTSKHINVDGLKKMNVALASQVFSNSVAGGLCTLSTLQFLPSSANFTADFCSKMNDLFDSVNSRVLHHKSRPLLSACTTKSVHMERWEKSLLFIKSIKFDTSGKAVNFPSLSGWINTLSAFIQMIPILLKSTPFVLMNRFTQDSLENFFSQLRRKGGNNDHPTPMDFLYRLRMLLAQNMINTCENANCESDNDKVLIPTNLISAFSNESNANTSPSLSVGNILSDYNCDDFDKTILTDVADGDILHKNASAYIAGYLASKSLKILDCNNCKKTLITTKDLTPETIFIYFKEFDMVKRGLNYPSLNLIETISIFGLKFQTMFTTFCYEPLILKKMTDVLINEPHDFLSCKSHSNTIWQYMVNLYLKMMIYAKVKQLSKNLPKVRNAKNKLKKLK